MKQSLSLKLSQQLSMTPQLQQAIRLLQLSTIELQTEIQTILESNLLLESIETTDEPEQETNFSWEMPSTQRHQKNTEEENDNDINRLSTTDMSLQDYLYWQLGLNTFSDLERLIGTAIIDGINEDGFLETTLEDILSILKQSSLLDEKNEQDDPINLNHIEAVLYKIQEFDPLGVGARSLVECLLIQAREQIPLDAPYRENLILLITSHLPLLAKRDYARLRKILHCSMDELTNMIQQVQTLHPKPGSKVSSTTSNFIIPDVIVKKQNNNKNNHNHNHNQWVTELNPACMPKIRINESYAALVRKTKTNQDSQVLRTQLQEARWFLKSLQNRQETLLKVATCIVEQQTDFLEYGPEYMKPLVLQDIASEINMHESTVSRVTTQKFLYTPRGTFELKYFFSSHINNHNGDACSATAIRAFIKKYIEQEVSHKPLSDSKLAQMLKEQGIPIARRTVAKYRETMAIPPSNERKKLL